MKLMKLLRHLTNVPVAIALAFLIVGAPAAPVAEGLLPTSGNVYASPTRPSDEWRRDNCDGPGGPMHPDCFGAPAPFLVVAAIVGIVGSVVSIISAGIWVYEALTGENVKDEVRVWVEEVKKARAEEEEERKRRHACDVARMVAQSDLVDDLVPSTQRGEFNRVLAACGG